MLKRENILFDSFLGIYVRRQSFVCVSLARDDSRRHLIPSSSQSRTDHWASVINNSGESMQLIV